MMSFGALKYFESVIKKLKKIIALYQPRDLHLCITFCMCTAQSYTLLLSDLIVVGPPFCLIYHGSVLG